MCRQHRPDVPENRLRLRVRPVMQTSLEMTDHRPLGLIEHTISATSHRDASLSRQNSVAVDRFPVAPPQSLWYAEAGKHIGEEMHRFLHRHQRMSRPTEVIGSSQLTFICREKSAIAFWAARAASGCRRRYHRVFSPKIETNVPSPVRTLCTSASSGRANHSSLTSSRRIASNPRI